jgi:hypothetical protein
VISRCTLNQYAGHQSNFILRVHDSLYSGAKKKYLVSHQLCKFSHLKRWERPVIFIIGTLQLWPTKWQNKSRKSHCRIFYEFICKLWWKISIFPLCVTFSAPRSIMLLYYNSIRYATLQMFSSKETYSTVTAFIHLVCVCDPGRSWTPWPWAYARAFQMSPYSLNSTLLLTRAYTALPRKRKKKKRQYLLIVWNWEKWLLFTLVFTVTLCSYC